jgi:hypothetical protein
LTAAESEPASGSVRAKDGLHALVALICPFRCLQGNPYETTDGDGRQVRPEVRRQRKIVMIAVMPDKNVPLYQQKLDRKARKLAKFAKRQNRRFEKLKERQRQHGSSPR